MKKGSSKCYALRAKIEKLVEQGLTQKQIAARLELTQPTISAGLKLLGISTKLKPPPPAQQPAPTIEEPMALPFYIDSNGNKVTLCPPRYAFGALMQSSIIRSSR